jgi:hypothetical protein
MRFSISGMLFVPEVATILQDDNVQVHWANVVKEKTGKKGITAMPWMASSESWYI